MSKVPFELNHRKKYLKEYLIEFFMLFLAVSLGFLAENLREQQSEANIGKLYLDELEVDLKKDSISLHNYSFLLLNQKEAADSIYAMYNKNNWKKKINELYFYHAIISLRSNWEPNDATWDQVISSGTLRFLNNRALIIKLKDYYFNIRNLKNRENRILTMMDNYFEFYRQNHFVSPSIIGNKDLLVVMNIINKSEKPKMPVFTTNWWILNRDNFEFNSYVNVIARLQGLRNLDLDALINNCSERNAELLTFIRTKK